MLSRRAAAAIAGCAATLIAVTASPAATAAPPTTAPGGGRTLYVTNGDTNDISIFTIGQTGDLTLAAGQIQTGKQPRGIVFAPDGDTAYVAASGANAVSAYRVGSGGELTQLAEYPTGGSLPFGIAITPTARRCTSPTSTTGRSRPSPSRATERCNGPATPSPASTRPTGWR